MHRVFSVPAWLVAAWTLAVLALLAPTPVWAEKRVALVVGNAKYAHHQQLKNPANDVVAVARTLKAADFRVISGQDLEKRDFEDLLKRFLRELDQADVALVYYSGHAVQVGGTNYLIPIDARLQHSHDLELETISLESIRGYIRNRSKVQLLFLDACRDNPFKGRSFQLGQILTRGQGTRGLARINASVGTLIAFSTEPDTVALDGEGQLSPFTAAFVKHALTPGLEVRHMLTKVRNEVRQTTANRQTPWENSSLLGSFYFMAAKQDPVVTKLHQVTVANSPAPGRVNAPAPYHPDGGNLKVTLLATPDKGRLQLDGTQLETGASFDTEAFARLRYDASGVSPGTVTLVNYRADDQWGNSADGVIVISVKPDADTTTTQSAAPSETADAGDGRKLAAVTSQLADHFERGASAPIGVGPVGFGPAKISEQLNGGRIVALRVPSKGTLQVADRTLADGQSFTMEDLSNASYLPAINTQGETEQAVFAVISEQGKRSNPLEVTFQPELHQCDKLAGEPFDLQGVATPGILPNEIRTKQAEAACIDAITSYPGVARFQYQLGRVAFAKGNSSQARQLFEAAAALGHIRATQALGMMYFFGAGVSPDAPKAVEHFAKAAAAGDPYALHSYGKRLFHGTGIEKDLKQGLTLMLQAAEIGHTYAMNELGFIFASGNGVRKDPERALRYFTVAADRKDIYGFNNLGYLYRTGIGVPQDFKQAFEWFKKAHEAGHPYAGANIGRMFFHGQGFPKSQAAAALWYELSAERGDIWSAVNRGWIALEGDDTLRDRVLAARYYALAAGLVKATLNADPEGNPGEIAKQQLAKIPASDKEHALVQLVAEATGDKSLAKRSKLDRQVNSKLQAFLTSKNAKAGKDLDTNLILTSRLNWLKTRPRLDLF